MLAYIEFENDCKIGNVKLDFMKDQEKAYDTIVLIGENGSGKTNVLNSIKNFLNDTYLWKSSSVKKVDYFDNHGRKREILRKEDSAKRDIPAGYSEKEVKDAIYDQNDFFREKEELLTEEPYDIRNRKYVYSEARSGFEIDLGKSDESFMDEKKSYEKNGADYTGIVQLLLDIEAKDDNEFLTYVKKNPYMTYSDYLNKYSSIRRFKNAFERIFDGMSYVGRDLTENTILFSKGDNSFDVSELSTGEKQIVFRGTDILYHAEKGGIVFIDEPELSLHPKWQKKILDFYRNLFKDANGNQIVQLIIATHSQYVVKSALEQEEDIKILVLKKENAEITVNEPRKLVLDKYESSEINYLVFGVEGEAYHTCLFAKLHEHLKKVKKSGVGQSIASFDKYIYGHKDFKPQIHKREDTSYKKQHYQTLPVFIRNAIDHPNENRQYSEQDLVNSIKLLRSIYGLENEY